MALELISSEVKRSLDYPSMILTCMWRDGEQMGYSAVICDATLLCNDEFWEYHEIEMARWFALPKSKRPKHGEIRCLPTFPSTSKPSASNPAA